MKICVIGLRGIPGIMGGVETHCEELLPRIAALGHDIKIEVCSREPYTGSVPTRVGDVTVTPLPSPRGKSTEALISTWRSVWHARRMRADAVHLHAVGPALFAPLVRLFGMKLIFTHHGADYDRDKWGRVARMFLRAGEAAGMYFSHQVICVSSSLCAQMTARFPSAAARTTYVPNGAAELPQGELDDEHCLAEFKLASHGYILAVARLVPEKGLDTLVEAHAQSGVDMPLVIAGAAMHDDAYSRQLKQSAGPNTYFLGALPRTQLGTLYRHTALFVLPSRHEGLPIAALEAMSSGSPILLSDIAANRDLGLPPDHYFPVNDVETLARRLRDAGELVGRDLSPLMAQFDWDVIALATARIYRSLDDAIAA